MATRTPVSDKSRGLALAIGVPLGIFGAHRFYAGKIGTGLLQLFTLGGLGVWWLYDMLLLVGGGFRDAEGRRVLTWDFEATGFEELDGPDASYGALAAEVDQLRADLADVHERLDFTERLIAQQQEARRLESPPAR